MSDVDRFVITAVLIHYFPKQIAIMVSVMVSIYVDVGRQLLCHVNICKCPMFDSFSKADTCKKKHKDSLDSNCDMQHHSYAT